ncbi:helix-turn-helix transcriptional regulator [Chitinophaga sp. OAE865]|uniref:helix-turn-helix domain-containing protein n=1 Tax=Chitinophaga sp. OAE865 TaxID=2817898 RepID=UPI001AE95EF0
MKLNERISKTRKEKGLTQAELADLANITTRTIQRIESGESIPRSFTIKAIAKALELPYETLLVKEIPLPIQQSGDTTHFLKMLNLSCFAYTLVPWVHFLVPHLILKKQKDLNEEATALSRKMIRQQVSWTIALHLLMLLTVALNLIQVRVFNNMYNTISYLWPVVVMYLLNAGIIFYNGLFIQRKYQQVDCQLLTGE